VKNPLFWLQFENRAGVDFMFGSVAECQAQLRQSSVEMIEALAAVPDYEPALASDSPVEAMRTELARVELIAFDLVRALEKQQGYPAGGEADVLFDGFLAREYYPRIEAVKKGLLVAKGKLESDPDLRTELYTASLDGIGERIEREPPPLPVVSNVVALRNWERAGRAEAASDDRQEDAPPAQASDVGSGESKWITISQAQRISSINKGTISRAADSKEIRTNGEMGRLRLLDSADFNRWHLERIDKPERQESDQHIQEKMRRYNDDN
jgi:hypothetical protein